LRILNRDTRARRTLSGGLGELDDPGGASPQALIGGDQGGVEGDREGDVKCVARRDAIGQFPRRCQEWLERPTCGSERGQCVDAFGGLGQLAGSP